MELLFKFSTFKTKKIIKIRENNFFFFKSSLTKGREQTQNPRLGFTETQKEDERNFTSHTALAHSFYQTTPQKLQFF